MGFSSFGAEVITPAMRLHKVSLGDAVDLTDLDIKNNTRGIYLVVSGGTGSGTGYGNILVNNDATADNYITTYATALNTSVSCASGNVFFPRSPITGSIIGRHEGDIFTLVINPGQNVIGTSKGVSWGATRYTAAVNGVITSLNGFGAGAVVEVYYYVK
jgi:hypothetical protein